jgi:hypothetical protein
MANLAPPQEDDLPRRTASAANLQLAELDFPEPSRVTAAARPDTAA